MRIGIISDTHIPSFSRELPRMVLSVFAGVDFIIHAGDIAEVSVLSQLGQLAPVVAVHGNRDPEEVKVLLPEKRVIDLEKFRIGIFHGHGIKGTTLQRIPTFFDNNDVDCVVFGHSHIPYCERYQGVLFINPGSPTDHKRKRTVGLLTLDEDISFQIIPLE